MVAAASGLAVCEEGPSSGPVPEAYMSAAVSVPWAMAPSGVFAAVVDSAPSVADAPAVVVTSVAVESCDSYA